MLVAADIDNTRVAVGVFDGAELRASFTLATDLRRTEDEYAFLLAGLLREHGVAVADVGGAALASVVPALSDTLVHVAERLFGMAPLVVGGGARTGIRIATQNPREVGENRIVNAVAAFHLHGGPAIVVDFGTATSFDVIGDDGAYLGGAIAPGLALGAEALTDRAARLFRVELSAPRLVVGRGTGSALQSGIVLGHACMVEGMVQRIQDETNCMHVVVATGEFAPLVLPYIRRGVQFVEPHLSLVGLRLLAELNAVGSGA